MNDGKTIKMSEVKVNRSIIILIWLFTAVVYALVIILHELPKSEWQPDFIGYLPGLNATLNATCFILLSISFFVIKKGNVGLHKKLNTTAMVLSVLFLLSYVTRNYFADDVIYQGGYRMLYLFILLTHILLAGVSLPFILLSYYHGFIDNRKLHKKLVKFVFPIWLYVTLTGVLVYLFLAPYYD